MAPMLKDWLNKYLTLFIVLIAFVDGMLVAQQFQGERETPSVSAVVLEDIFEQKISSTIEPEIQVNLVPFVSQAPYGIWNDPWASFAEEAAAYMSYLWANGLEAPSREIIGQALLSIQKWELANLGTYKDTNLDQTLRILTEFYGLQAQISYDVTRETIQAHLDQGSIVLVPVQNLQNPHYGEPGPVFHTLLIYAYEGENFITNDPGTSRGEAFSYENQKILESIQDLNGEVRMLVLGRAE